MKIFFSQILNPKRILVLLTKTKKESRPLQQLNLFGICRQVESAKYTLTPIRILCFSKVYYLKFLIRTC